MKEVNSFISGIERNLYAVNNALIYDYSNGLAEGKLNKVIVIEEQWMDEI